MKEDELTQREEPLATDQHRQKQDKYRYRS